MTEKIDEILKMINDHDGLVWAFIRKAAEREDPDCLKKALQLKDFMDLVFNHVAALKVKK